MPSPSDLGHTAVTISDKIKEIGQQGLGTVSGVVGTLSSGATQSAAAFGAFVDRSTNLLKQSNITPAALAGAAAQVTESLQQTSIYKGILKGAPVATEKQPEETRRVSGGNVLKFPADLGDHYVQFTFASFKQDSPVTKQIKTEPVIIQLPLTPTLVETYQANYKTESLGVLGGMADSVLKKFEAAGGFQMTGEKAGEALGGAVGEVTSMEGKAGLTSLTASAVMAATPGLGAAVSRALGASINPNLAVLFDNIGFRSHQFAFKLNPRNAAESAVIKEIIAIMRQRMLPPTVNQFFYGFPDKVIINIFPKDPYPILECVLESMSINYAPNGPAFYKGSQGNPVEVDIQLQFKEIEIFTRDVAVGRQGIVKNINDRSNQERDQ